MKTRRSNSTLLVATMVLIPSVLLPGFAQVYSQEKGLGVKVWTVAPDPVVGTMKGFSMANGAVMAGATRDVTIPIDDIIRVESEGNGSRVTRRAAFGARKLRGAMVFELGHGDWAVATPLGYSEDRCKLALGGGAELHMPLDAIVAVYSEMASLAAHADAVRSFVAMESRDDDRILLSNGDVLRGFIDRLDATGLTLENGAGAEVVPYRVIVVAKFATAVRARPVEPYVRVHLGSGARLTCTAINIDRGKVAASYVDGELVAIGARNVARLDVIGGRWQALSSLRPLTYEHTAMLGLHWEYRRDSNVLGDAIQVGGESFEAGLGVHSRSRLSFELKGQFVEFVTRFGLDDSAGPMADVDISILVDGTKRFSATGVRVGTLSDIVRIDVRQAKRIELVVDFGRNGDVQDRFDWVEPGLIR